MVNVRFSELSDNFPFIGNCGVGSASALRTAAWQELPNEFKDSIFLLSLVLAASMMLVLAASMMLAHTLPDASERVAMRLGFRLRRVR